MQGKICDILRPQLVMNRFLPFGHTDAHTLYTYIWGEGACGGSDIRSMSRIRPICKCRCPPLDCVERICVDIRSFPAGLVGGVPKVRSDEKVPGTIPPPLPLLKWGQGASEDTGINRYRATRLSSYRGASSHKYEGIPPPPLE